MRRISADILAAIRERCEKASPGPWKWTHDEWNKEKYGDKARRLGFSKTKAWWVFLQAPRPHASDYERNILYPMTIREIDERRAGDEYDFRQLIALRRCDTKPGRGFVPPSDEDQAFIAEARSDVPALLDALEAAYAEIDRLQGQEGQREG